MSKLRQALNYLEILKEALKLPSKNPTLILKIAFFILFPSNLILFAVDQLDLSPTFHIKKQETVILQFELFRDMFQWLAMTLAIYLLSKAYTDNNSSCSLLQLLSTLQTRWAKIFVTSVLTELVCFSSSTLLLLLGYPIPKTLFRFVMAMIGFGIYVFLYLFCQLTIVITSVEESSYGLIALRRGAEIINGRKVQAFLVMVMVFVFDALVNFQVGIAMQLIWCSVYCVLYLESMKRQGTEEDVLRWIV